MQITVGGNSSLFVSPKSKMEEEFKTSIINMPNKTQSYQGDQIMNNMQGFNRNNNNDFNMSIREHESEDKTNQLQKFASGLSSTKQVKRQ